ncbi:MAG TPA: alpha/beta hydrolase [Acidimicrobiales bacterium]|jgi:pimeloyl-ACP methyl ester carboxylesterase|nr:alpha/beta hydrolase [Acidimicrobiales bacterium]
MEPAPSSPPERLDVQVGQAVLSAFRQGAGGSPTIVFLHAGIADHRAWSAVMEALSPACDVVAYDRRGFGTSFAPAEEHSQVVDLMAVLDALGPGTGPVVLVGNSRGGQIALDAALAHPDRLLALVLVAPAVTGSPTVDETLIGPVERAIWENIEAAYEANALDALNLAEIRLWLDGPSGPEGRISGPVRDLALDMNRIALHAESPGHEPAPPDAWSRLDRIDCPTLVVVGDRDLLHQQARARAVAAAIPGAELVVMVGAAHLPGLEQPDDFAALLRRFLAL